MSSLAISSLIGGKLKLCSGLAVASISAITVPVVWITNGTGKNNIVNQINTTIASASETINSHLSETSQALKGEYGNMVQQTPETFTTQTIGNITDQWKSGEDMAKGSYKFIHENIEEINYYVFILGDLIKSAISFIPTSIRDTIVHNEETKKNQQLLSIQKIMAIVKMEEFQQFAAKMAGLIQKYHDLIKDKLTMTDGKDLMKIFREVTEGNFEIFMKTVENNISKIPEGKKYRNATDLLKDVFVGVDEINKLRDYIQKLQRKIDELGSKLEEKGLQEGEINKFKAKLEELLSNKALMPDKQ